MSRITNNAYKVTRNTFKNLKKITDLTTTLRLIKKCILTFLEFYNNFLYWKCLFLEHAEGQFLRFLSRGHLKFILKIWVSLYHGTSRGNTKGAKVFLKSGKNGPPYSITPLIRPPLGPNQMALSGGWPY